ncbi:lysine 2,3-aminomutase [Micromonospora sp. WMMD975]|uniref:KamA family radical SAM protein n=1 Tax=Micromonospora sp. WMMD975 TaxID=3016087 RepID=UPI00249B022E|nr:lysine 2,3-aminomutase [Micromonospora sp. WMMD975]WFE36314.1 lysine 2,3-aminomutase [Micromonospora sp. WMMD975]
MKVYSHERLARLAGARGMPEEYVHDLRVVSSVLPFKVNQYVVDELIDWSAVPNDPIFRLTFPHRDMLPPELYDHLSALHLSAADPGVIRKAARDAHARLNPNPGAQLEANVPTHRGRRLLGLQHKYAETVLVFPSQGQTCHSYCGYCFRWAQFVGNAEIRQAASDVADVAGYLADQPGVTDVLFTGGDPMIMSAAVLDRWVSPLLDPALERIRTLRFGTKALSYWPARFTTDPDAGDLLRLFERIVAGGRHVAVMAHFSHPRELATDEVRRAIARIRATGAVIRTQAPLIAHVNDRAGDWAAMWQRSVELGMVPYYMFVERDTGARSYFSVPLERAWQVYTDAVRSVSGLARTARGPVMSAAPGKVLVDGVARVGGADLFSLRMLQARDAGDVGRQFFARYDPTAEWFDDLRPAHGSWWPA